MSQNQLSTTRSPPIFRLPIELRLEILSYVFVSKPNAAFILYESPLLPPTGLYLDLGYSVAPQLSVLLTCHQFRSDFTELAFKSVTFVIKDTVSPISPRFKALKQSQIQSLRDLVLVVGNEQLNEVRQWEEFTFDLPSLRLDTLTLVFHRTGYWQNPEAHVSSFIALFRRLKHVERIKFIRNGANVKGGFKAFYNRLIGKMLKEDHFQRYDAPGAPNLPTTWWEWKFDVSERSFELRGIRPWEHMREEEYMERVRPLVEQWMRDMETEEEGELRRGTGAS
jgi:hypothetical protein